MTEGELEHDVRGFAITAYWAVSTQSFNIPMARLLISTSSARYLFSPSFLRYIFSFIPSKLLRMVLPIQPSISLPISSAQLEEINNYLSTLEPQEILDWGLLHLPQLFQSTGMPSYAVPRNRTKLIRKGIFFCEFLDCYRMIAFGLTGLASIDMLSKLTSNPPPLIFIDTLYHFKETLELKDEVQRRYGVPIHVYQPSGASTVHEFEALYGERLWETNDAVYDYWAKVYSSHIS